MAGWNNKNCCCEPKTYTCADGTEPICCMTLQKSTWSRAVSLYTPGITPDEDCSAYSGPYKKSNACGYVQIVDGCVGVVAEVWWGIQQDGTVKLTYNSPYYFENDGTYHQAVRHEVTGLDPDTWYLSPVVFSVSGITYTLNVCPYMHTTFPPYPPVPVYLGAYGPFTTYGGGVGNLLCGGPCNPLVSTASTASVRWGYDIKTDSILLGVSTVTHSGSVSVDYDDGNWAAVRHTVPLISTAFDPTSAVVFPEESCDIPPPPPPCEVENACFPDGCPCITLGEDGTLYRTLYADISGPVTATGLTLTTYLNEGWDYSSGSDSISIRCTNGGVDPYYVFVNVGGTVMFGSIPAGGFDCTPDGLDIVDITVTDGTTTMVLYTL